MFHLLMQERQVPPPGQNDPLEKEMVTDSSILAWEVPWTEEPAGPQSIYIQSMGSRKSRTQLTY